MPFMANIESDEQGGDLLDNAGILKLSAIKRTQARDFCRQFRDRLNCILVVAADDYVAFDWAISVHHVGRTVLKSGYYGHTLGDEFGGLLSGGTLPHPERATGTATHSAGKRHRSVD